MEKVVTDIIVVEAELTDCYQTTVPEAVRRALQLGDKDKIRYTIHVSGEVILSRIQESADYPSQYHFLASLAGDIDKSPQHLQRLDADFVKKIQSLVEGVEVNLDAPLEEGDD